MKKTKSINKLQFARKLAKEYGYTIKDALGALDDIFELINSTVENDCDLHFNGFGVFTKRTRKEKNVRHPATKEIITVNGYTTLAFKCSELTRDRFSGKNNQSDNKE